VLGVVIVAEESQLLIGWGGAARAAVSFATYLHAAARDSSRLSTYRLRVKLLSVVMTLWPREFSQTWAALSKPLLAALLLP
jgi:hypothetical protein